MKNTINTFVLFLVTILILRHIIINYVSINKYLLLFIFTFSSIYYFSKNYDIALFSSIITIFVRTIYRYIVDANNIENNTTNLILFIFYACTLYYIIIHNKKIKYNLSIANFILIIYILYSGLEILIHKYVMHCKNSFNIPFLSDRLNSTCKHHKEHHLYTEPDMNIRGTKEEASDYGALHFRWETYFILLIITFLLTVLSGFIANYNISLFNSLVLSSVLSFIYCYLWNKIHKDMHNIKNDFSILDGPYDNGLFNLSTIKDFLFKNHELHHLQKGDKKGNYNIILFGADEWFGYNNKTVENTEYCKTHNSEKICQMK